MGFMSDEEFNRVMDEFDWDAPIDGSQSEQKRPESCSQSTAEASRGPPCPMTPQPPLGPSTSEPVARVKSPEDPFGPTISTDHTRRKTTNDTYVLPAEIYYDPEHFLFWDHRDHDWTRPPRLSANRPLGLHQNGTEPSASTTTERFDGTREEPHVIMKETESSSDKSPSNCPTDSIWNKTGPVESKSSGTDLSLPDHVAPSTPNSPVTSKLMDVQCLTSCQEISSGILIQQGNEVPTDVAPSKDHPSATEQGNDDTSNATISEDPTNATKPDDGVITNVRASTDHASPLQLGDEIAAALDISEECIRAIDQGCEVITNMPVLKDRVDCIQQGNGIIIDMTIPNDPESTTDQGNEIISRVLAHTNHASPIEQGDGTTANVDISKECDRAIDQDGEAIIKAPAFKDRVDSIEQSDEINTNASVSQDYESTIDQGSGNGQHEASPSGTTVAQDSAEVQGIEKISTMDSTETRPMAKAPKRPQRLFSSAVSLSSIPVRGGVKTRKSVNPLTTRQPPNPGRTSDISEPPTGIPQDIGESSDIVRTIITAPASATPSNPAGPSESASDVQSSPASRFPTPEESYAHSRDNAGSTHSPPPMNAPQRASKIGKSLETPHDPHAISIIDASTPAEHPTPPVEAIDLIRSTSTQSASTDGVAPPSEIEGQFEQSSYDEKHRSTEDHAENSKPVVDLTQVTSTSNASTPIIDLSYSPEAIHEALPSPITNACALELFPEPGVVQGGETLSVTDVELPQKPLHDAQTSLAPASFANIDPPIDAPAGVYQATSHSEGNLAHPIRPQKSLHKVESSSAPEVAIAKEHPVGPQKSVLRKQSLFVQFVCTPTEEPVSSLEAAEADEAQPSPIAEASIPVHINPLAASHEGQALPAPDTDSLTEKHVEPAEAAHARSEALTVRSSEPTEDSGASLEAAQEVKDHRNGPDEVTLVESKSQSVALLEPSNPRLKVVVPSAGDTLTPPDSRRSSLRGKTPLKISVQEPMSSLQEPTLPMEEPGIIGNIDATADKLDRTTPKPIFKSKSRARSPSTTNRSTRSNTRETSTHPTDSTLPTQTVPLPDDDSALQVEQAEALPGGDDIRSLAQQQASGNDARLARRKKASQAELSSEYDDELAMSDPEDPRCIPFAVQLTPRRKHQVHTPQTSPSVERGNCPKSTQSTDKALSVNARKRAKTGPQGRKRVGDRELAGLLMRPELSDMKVRRMGGNTEMDGLAKKPEVEAESSKGKATEDAHEKRVGKVVSEQTPSRKRVRNKSLDSTSNGKAIEKKPRRSGRLSDGVDPTEDVKAAKIDKPRRSGRLVDGVMK